MLTQTKNKENIRGRHFPEKRANNYVAECEHYEVRENGTPWCHEGLGCLPSGDDLKCGGKTHSCIKTFLKFKTMVRRKTVKVGSDKKRLVSLPTKGDDYADFYGG